MKYVVLGMLLERRGYGYELRARIDERLPFLRYSPGTVYVVLDQLDKEGLVVAVGPKDKGKSTRGSPRIRYEATPEGADQFERWIAAPSPPELSRDELLTKIELARPQDLPKLIALAKQHKDDQRSEAGALAEAPAQEWTDSGKVRLRIVTSNLARAVKAMKLATEIESLDLIIKTLEQEIRPAPTRSDLRGRRPT